MVAISARSIYLMIASAIILVFIATGAFYVLNLEKPADTDEQTELADSSASTETDNQEIEEDVSASTPAPTSTPTSTPTPQATLALCFETCEFSFQCSGELECLEVGDEYLCVNNQCPTNSACDCTQEAEVNVVAEEPEPTSTPTPTPTSTPEPEESSNYLADSGGIGGASSSAILTTDPPVAEEPVYSPQLPDAGTQELTLIILIAGLLSSGLGLAWRKVRK
jgi:LPXTG-motif cell wall-anchored protein